MTPLTVAQLPTKLLLRPDCLEVWYGISVDPANPGRGSQEVMVRMSGSSFPSAPTNDKHASALQVEKGIPVMNFPDIFRYPTELRSTLLEHFGQKDSGVFSHGLVILLGNV